MTTSSKRPLRADARRNRDLIVETARAAFASKGVDASLEEIAKTVGVGQGTLYRHFPTREDLIAAAIQDDVEQLARNADKRVRARYPLKALGEWLRELALFSRTYSGLPNRVLDASVGKSGSFAELCGSLESLTDRVLVRGKETGQIRADVTAEDVFLLANAVAWSLTKARGTELLEKHIAILLRGIASGTNEV
ncbi:Transcriptional regulator, TetR family [Devosia sp. LC5]|uniref:TetR/AcrR family transcriptional regulator n=1 Tax=Devosia sp. LC5 TaxID=1502724 RepID=UPI0004E35963|nr:TetR/AcrR family transcriptional regulator [Devosia sp. LC5]KFC64435.1 Transcriptional regulator, TetR family [Devosia sp. LC5]